MRGEIAVKSRTGKGAGNGDFALGLCDDGGNRLWERLLGVSNGSCEYQSEKENTAHENDGREFWRQRGYNSRFLLRMTAGKTKKFCLCAGLVVLKDGFDGGVEEAGEAKGERQTGIEFAGLDCVDTLPGDFKPLRQIGLAPLPLCAEDSQTVFHSLLWS